MQHARPAHRRLGVGETWRGGSRSVAAGWQNDAWIPGPALRELRQRIRFWLVGLADGIHVRLGFGRQWWIEHEEVPRFGGELPGVAGIVTRVEPHFANRLPPFRRHGLRQLEGRAARRGREAMLDGDDGIPRRQFRQHQVAQRGRKFGEGLGEFSGNAHGFFSSSLFSASRIARALTTISSMPVPLARTVARS